MKINIDIDKNNTETSITIKAKEWTAELKEIISFLNRKQPQRLFGVDNDQTVLLEPEEIDFVYAKNRRIYAALNKQSVEIRMKLYEVEEALATYDFMRFSKSVVGNINRIQRFELSFNGNLCIYFHSGNKEYITRKYVPAIKERLMMGGHSDENKNR